MNHYYIPLTDQPDENTFLCGYNRVRKYGTTVSSTETKPKHFIIYQVQPSDTIQGIALKNNCSVSEIVRINKLWSVDSLHFKETIKIPVVGSPDDNVIVADYSPKSFENHMKSQISNVSSNSGVDMEEAPSESLKDMLSRIDETIKSTSSSVKKLERSSTIVKEFAEQARPEHHSLQNLCSGYYQQI
ncbi:unnamed protein product [Auanema sp. JU1783]|nr:unnamed protein product [Auanema sp. JU1783]